MFCFFLWYGSLVLYFEIRESDSLETPEIWTVLEIDRQDNESPSYPSRTTQPPIFESSVPEIIPQSKDIAIGRPVVYSSPPPGPQRKIFSTSALSASLTSASPRTSKISEDFSVSGHHVRLRKGDLISSFKRAIYIVIAFAVSLRV